MAREWLQSTDLFERASRTSNVKGILISTYTNNKFKGPEGIPALSAKLNPLHEAYGKAYDEHQLQVAAERAATQDVIDLFDSLVTNARDWDIKIQTMFAKGSGDYIKILPKGRAPFYSGPKDMRIRAANQLSLATAAIPQLASIKTGAENAYTALTDAVAAQEEQRTITVAKAAALEAARLAVCEGLCYVLGGLRQHFSSEPKRVDDYFRLDLIRNIKQKVYTGTLGKNERKEIVKRKQSETSMLRITNNGDESLEFYFAADKDGKVPEGTIPLLVAAGATVNVPATMLGNIENPYLFVYNSSTLVGGDWEVGM